MIHVKDALNVRNTNITIAERPVLRPFVESAVRKQEVVMGIRNRFVAEIRISSAMDVTNEPDEYLIADVVKGIHNYIYGDIINRLEEISYILQADSYHGQSLLRSLLNDIKETGK